jgi:hypothetical protein
MRETQVFVSPLDADLLFLFSKPATGYRKVERGRIHIRSMLILNLENTSQTFQCRFRLHNS